MNVTARLLTALMLVSLSHQSFAMSTDSDTASPHAMLVPKSGTYSRAISTDVALAQTYFDQGLRLAWGFYFPESIASYQEASRLDPTHPMPYWGIAHAAGPNPNSRYAQMPDDPQGAGLTAIEAALDRIDRATPMEAALIKALYVFYDAKSCLLYTSPSPRDRTRSRMPSSA